MIDKLIELRRSVHQHPEISGEEVETAAAVVEYLNGLNYTNLQTQVGGNGILVLFDSGKAGKTLMFRAELDGLPIQEESEIEYQSIYKDKGHQCGHDGHLTMLAGLGTWISENPLKRGKVYLLFQPAEENGEGAKAVMGDARFKDLKIDEVYALHNLPGYPIEQIVIKENSFTAAVNSIIIKLKGKTSHAAEPEKGYNPSLAVSQILEGIEKFQNNHPEQDDFRLVTPIYVTMGSQNYGISAGEAEIHLTLRSWTNEGLDELQNLIINHALKVSQLHHLEFSHYFLAHFYANINHIDCVETVRIAAKNAHLDIYERSFPFKWGEDFGIFTTKFNGCMFGLGSGENQPALHNPDYDFPDSLIPTGITIFSEIIKTQLQ